MSRYFQQTDKFAKIKLMIITVFGATGQVGKRIVRAALAQEFKVRAFGRNIEPFIDEGLRNKNLVPIKGHVFDAHEVLDAVKGSDVVLSALGGSIDTNNKTRSLGIKNIIEEMQKTGVKRIITVGSSAVLKDDDYGFVVNDPKYPALYKPVGLEHLKAYEYLSASHLNWTIVCCPSITDEDANGHYVTCDDYPPNQNLFTVKAGNIADFIIKEIKSNSHLKKRVGISDTN
jgi:putative NADH-flavin reductase